MNTGEILIYQSAAGNIKVDVRLEDETVWLTREQMASLFGKGRSTIAEHIINVFGEGELEQNRTCRKFRQLRQEGLREVEREIDHYNLDVIISVGYRVKSHQDTQFRIWAKDSRNKFAYFF
ncbi:MAG: cell filamentation protein Fic [Bacteroidetes bacterium HGW-Bacteroidetes-1]|nr:MAG: cell filamentation protein Fic [Bacteroidetes bacterium HGW-Bacteroidetes-1]